MQNYIYMLILYNEIYIVILNLTLHHKHLSVLLETLVNISFKLAA